MSKLFKNVGYVAAIAALLVGASLLAQTSAAPGSRQSIGALDTLDTAAMTFKVQVENQLQTIAYDASTVFMDHGAKIELAGLQRGDKLKVDWIQKDSKKVAVRVEIVEKAPGAPGGGLS